MVLFDSVLLFSIFSYSAHDFKYRQSEKIHHVVEKQILRLQKNLLGRGNVMEIFHEKNKMYQSANSC